MAVVTYVYICDIRIYILWHIYTSTLFQGPQSFWFGWQQLSRWLDINSVSHILSNLLIELSHLWSELLTRRFPSYFIFTLLLFVLFILYLPRAFSRISFNTFSGFLAIFMLLLVGIEKKTQYFSMFRYNLMFEFGF